MADTQTDSRSVLETIPVEIKFKIFALALATTDTINADRPTLAGFERTPHPTLGVGLLGTCHQYYHEARPFLYAEKTLLFAGKGFEMFAWCFPVGLERCKVIGCDEATYWPVINHAIISCIDETEVKGNKTHYSNIDTTLHNVLLRGGVRVNHLELHLERPGCNFILSLRVEDHLSAIKGVESVEIVGGELLEGDVKQLCYILFGENRFVVGEKPSSHNKKAYCGHVTERIIELDPPPVPVEVDPQVYPGFGFFSHTMTWRLGKWWF
ncbi:hypothetical protein MMC16_002348 [Acarospora aff. strigata]|nr:hypothetical protein [Acarospora aff. strigata]